MKQNDLKSPYPSWCEIRIHQEYKYKLLTSLGELIAQFDSSSPRFWRIGSIPEESQHPSIIRGFITNRKADYSAIQKQQHQSATTSFHFSSTPRRWTLHSPITSPDHVHCKKKSLVLAFEPPARLRLRKKASESLQPDYGTLSQNGYGTYMYY